MIRIILALILTLLATACGDAYHIVDLDERKDAVVPANGDYRSTFASEDCAGYARVIVPEGWCVTVAGNIGDVVHDSETIASCDEPSVTTCQVFTGLSLVYLQGEYRFAKTGCHCP